jgi:hypothetical protein
MTTPATVRRRTEGELRAALTKLERLSPAADEVLSRLRDPSLSLAVRRPLAGQRPRGGRRHRPGRANRPGGMPWWAPRPWLAVGAATVAAAAATVAVTAAAWLTMALLPDSVPAPSGALNVTQALAAKQMSTKQSPSPYPQRAAAFPTDSAVLPSAASVGRAMLAASIAASGDVLYTTEADLTGGVIQQVYQAWAWPLQPAAGQRAQWRQTSSQRGGSGGLELAENAGFAYTAPPAGATGAAGTLTVVCYPGTGRSRCGTGATAAPGGPSWSMWQGRFVNPGPGPGGLSLALLGHDLVAGLWQVTGRTQANGEQVIVLSEAKAGSYQPMPAQLWVDAQTYLPQRILWGTGRDVTQVAWHYLAPTMAMRALLQVRVPYRHATPASE